MKVKKIVLIISLLLILTGSSLGYAVQTDYGNIRIEEVQFTGTYGNTIHGYLYIPKGVTKENPAPVVINIHGYMNVKEHQTGFSVEYARRGYVVLAIDMPGHGYSDPVPGAFIDFLTGGPEAFKYVSDLDFVQKDKIALEGHSMGGWNCSLAAQVYGDKINTIVLVGSSSGTFGTELFDKNSPFNFAVVFGKSDEFVGLNWEVDSARDINKSEKLKKSIGIEEDIEYGKLYGSFENKTARTVYLTPTTHAGEHMSKEAIGAAIEFVQNAMPASNVIPATDQVWPMHEFAKLLNLIGIGIFIIFLGGLLLDSRYFNDLVQDEIEILNIKGGKVIWTIFAIITTAIPALTYFKFKGDRFEILSGTLGSAISPQVITTSTAKWAVLNGILMLILFLVWHYAFGKNAGGSAISYGISTSSIKKEFSWKYIGKTVLLAGIILGSMQLVQMMIGHIFKIDFRFWVVGFKALNASHFKMVLIYFWPFLIFFLISALTMRTYLRMNKFEGRLKEAIIPYLVAIIINGLGMLILVMMQYLPLIKTGIPPYPNYGLEAVSGFQLVITLPFAGIITTYFSKKTSNIYLPAFINAGFIAMYIVVNQAVQYLPK